MDPADLEPTALFHLATVTQWTAYEEGGAIVPASLDDEGFVHCSWGRQVAGTVRKHFAGVDELLALELDPGRIAAPVVAEDTSGAGQAFPHVYGPVPTGAVLAAYVLSAPPAGPP